MKIQQNSVSPLKPQQEVQKTSSEVRNVSTESPTTQKETGAIGIAQQNLGSEAKAFSSLSAGISQASLAKAFPDRAQLLNNAAKELIPKLPVMLSQSQSDPDKFKEAVLQQVESSTTWAVLGPMNGQDIEAIAFLVLMQAAKSAQEDLRSVMEKVKGINNTKQEMRELLADAQSRTTKKDDDD